MTARRSQAEHDRMVAQVAALLNSRGYANVCADLPNFTQPKRIMWESTGEGDYPDVTGEKEGLRIFEVETHDSIDDSHTARQWKLFAAFAQDNDLIFYIVFPQGSLPRVKQRLTELGIQAQLFEV
jgi:hypothetical protein